MSEFPQLDLHALRHWYFPLNEKKRAYQFDIIKQCLASNTLVALPTGLGKTFIASVVLYNYHRWFPKDGKIVFLAPTRPLVTQQIQATLTTVDLDPSQVVELNGSQTPARRMQAWNEKSVFFLTPQVLQNDLISGICPAKHLVLLIFDEAHRATGNHAYCEIMRMMCEKSKDYFFRVLALTATPASSVQSVQQLIDNLLISQIAIRTEESFDVRPYVHGKMIEKVVVKESAEVCFIKTEFDTKILQPYIDRLVEMGVMGPSPASSLSGFRLIQCRDAFRARQSGAANNGAKGVAEGVFVILIALYHARDLLILHGILSFRTYLTGENFNSRAASDLRHNALFAQLISHIDNVSKEPGFLSHPKLSKLISIVSEYFEADGTENNSSSKIIIFSQYRESVYEIVMVLNQRCPKSKVQSFVGKSNINQSSARVSQKTQIQGLREFTEGRCNVLVATCIGEEGLDIGNVDLIVCFDMQSSPIRMLQRIGRTGRHRKGKIFLLLCEGIEEDRYEKTKSKQKTVLKAISNPNRSLSLYRPEQTLFSKEAAPSAIEKVFDLARNIKFVSEGERGIKRKRSEFKDGPIRSPSISIADLEKTEIPNAFKYHSWVRSDRGVAFIQHSLKTRSMLNLFKDFDEHFADSADEDTVGLNTVAISTNKSKKDFAEIESELTDAMNEMIVFARRPSSSGGPKPLAASWHRQKFDAEFPPKMDEEPKSKASRGAVVSVVLDADMENIEIPDDMFSQAMPTDEEILPCLDSMKLESSPPALVERTIELRRDQNNPNNNDSALPSTLHSPIPVRKHSKKAIMSSQSLSSPCHPSPDYNINGECDTARSNRRPSLINNEDIRALILDEADCSVESSENDQDEISTSLAAFIKDDEEEEFERNNSLGSNMSVATEGSSNPPTSQSMMAFYRKTAFSSVHQPSSFYTGTDPPTEGDDQDSTPVRNVIATPVSTTPSPSPIHPPTNVIETKITDMPPMDDIDWSSDLEI